jgi:hypothetical protein
MPQCVALRVVRLIEEEGEKGKRKMITDSGEGCWDTPARSEE